MSKKIKALETAVKRGTTVVTGVQKVAEGYQAGQGIYKNLTTPEEKEIAVVTEQEAKEIVALYDKFRDHSYKENTQSKRAC